MRVGVSSLGCPAASLEAFCWLAAEFGISQLELRSLNDDSDYLLHLATSATKRQEARSVLAETSTQLRLLASSFTLGPGDNDLPSLLKIGQLADDLEVPYVRIFGGKDFRQSVSLYREALAALAAADIQCTLLVETHGGLVTRAAIEQFFEDYSGPVPLLWDCHNTWRDGGDPLEHTFAFIHPWIRHVHCKDSRTDADSAKGYTLTLPGKGEFPFDELFQLTAQLDPDICLSLEWEKRWHPELPPLANALERWVDSCSLPLRRFNPLPFPCLKSP